MCRPEVRRKVSAKRLPITGKQTSIVVLIRTFTLQHLLIWRTTPRSPFPRREDSQVVDSQTPNRLDAGALLASLSGRCQAFYRVLPAIRARANGLWRACSARYLRPIQLWEGSKGRSLYVALTPLAVPP